MMICRPTASITVTFSGPREAPVPFTHHPQHPAHSRCLQGADGGRAGMTAEHPSSRDPDGPGALGAAGAEGLTWQERWGVESDLKARQTTERSGTLQSSREGARRSPAGTQTSRKARASSRFWRRPRPPQPQPGAWEDPMTSRCAGGGPRSPQPPSPC